VFGNYQCSCGIDVVIVLYSTRHQMHFVAASVTSLRVAAFDQNRGLCWSVPLGILAVPHTEQSMDLKTFETRFCTLFKIDAEAESVPAPQPLPNHSRMLGVVRSDREDQTKFTSN
jgi:hypothetical protein